MGEIWGKSAMFGNVYTKKTDNRLISISDTIYVSAQDIEESVTV